MRHWDRRSGDERVVTCGGGVALVRAAAGRDGRATDRFAGWQPFCISHSSSERVSALARGGRGDEDPQRRTEDEVVDQIGYTPTLVGEPRINAPAVIGRCMSIAISTPWVRS
jgi:hypothetical protein